MSPILTLFRKEGLAHLRDRRSLYTALAFPVLAPLLIWGMMVLMASWANSDEPVHLALKGEQHAPHLVAFLEEHGVRPVPAPADYEKQIEKGKLDAALVVSDDYAKAFTHGRPAPVELVFDDSQRKSTPAVTKVKGLLRLYSGQIGAMRLLARGVSPKLAQPLAVQKVDLATPEQLAAVLLSALPMMLVLAAFMGGMNIAIDSTAGERERGSLEPLLINPVERSGLVLGKWLATSAAAIVSVVLTTLGFAWALTRIPLEDFGVKAHMGPREILLMTAVLVPLALLFAAVQLWVSTFARSYKEAQTSLSIVLMIPMIPGMLLMFLPVGKQLVLEAVPLLGQYILINDVLKGEAFSALGLLCATVPVLLLTWGCLAATTKLLSSERVIFGRAS